MNKLTKGEKKEIEELIEENAYVTVYDDVGLDISLIFEVLSKKKEEWYQQGVRDGNKNKLKDPN